MAFDEAVAQRIRKLLARRKGLTEKKMFGGIAFMLHGNMCCGVLGDEIILRLGPDLYEHALRQPFTRKFDFTGRPMRGFVVVQPDGYEADHDLKRWIQMTAEFVKSLPAK